MSPEELEPVAGHRVLRRVGHGGSGVVYLAEQAQPARLVALKVLSLPVDERSLRRFDREYEVSVRLGGHPHIIAVFGHGTTRAGQP